MTTATKPKFKKGQKVKFTDGGDTFTIFRATSVDSEWMYGLIESKFGSNRLYPEKELTKA